ncbi:MAG: hypothetical protein QNI84_17005 [Henriciella sp.]|nr:hypothetical protein [Henriciella sp.]
MQATSSQVTEISNAAIGSTLFADTPEEEPGHQIMIDLTKAAAASQRSHILVGRRKRATRRAVR